MWHYCLKALGSKVIKSILILLICLHKHLSQFIGLTNLLVKCQNAHYLLLPCFTKNQNSCNMKKSLYTSYFIDI